MSLLGNATSILVNITQTQYIGHRIITLLGSFSSQVLYLLISCELKVPLSNHSYVSLCGCLISHTFQCRVAHPLLVLEYAPTWINDYAGHCPI